MTWDELAVDRFPRRQISANPGPVWMSWQTDRSVYMIGCMPPIAERPKPASVFPRPPDSRLAILEVAEGLFASGGYAGVGMRQLATAAGLSKSCLFHHFPTKRLLYSAVLDRVFGRIAEGLEAVPGPEKAPGERLEEWIDAFMRALADDRPAGRLTMRALLGEEPFPAVMRAATLGPGLEQMPLERRLAAIVDRLRGLLEAGIARGAFRPVSVGDAISSVIGTVVFHAATGDLGDSLSAASNASDSTLERRRREVSEFIRSGLLA
ncbi:MAG: hypothetical protein CL933_18560 [Deltaproteobacteria bacterium]|nr:hypothetical protein [Deltaproteobacteria bacterium]